MVPNSRSVRSEVGCPGTDWNGPVHLWRRSYECFFYICSLTLLHDGMQAFSTTAERPLWVGSGRS